MSVIKLVSMVGFRYRENDAPEILFGADAVRFDEVRGQWVFSMGNVPTVEAMALPSQGLSLLYGFREVIDETAYWKKRVEDVGGEFHAAYLNVEVGEIHRATVGKAEIESLKFASIRRLKSELQHEILDDFSRQAKEESMDLKAFSRVKEIARHPEFLDHTLNLPIFRNLEVFVYPVEDMEKVKYFAYVKRAALKHCAIGIDQNERMQWRIDMPS